MRSVPGAPKAVGTWAGYVEVGIQCEAGANKFGYGVDMPISHPYNRANRHGAEDQFDLTVPHRTGRVSAQEVGTPFSKSTVRLAADSIDDPRNALKVLVPVRPRSPDDTPESNDIGLGQLIGFGGLFAQYGEAIQSGNGSCGDFGLKPFPKATFPPTEGAWVVLHVSGTEAGARRINRELRAGPIKGKVRLTPAPPDQVGHYMGLKRVPPLPKHYHGAGNRIDIAFNDLPHVHGPSANDVALRRYAFNAFPNARWIFYVGRAPGPGEGPRFWARTGWSMRMRLSSGAAPAWG